MIVSGGSSAHSCNLVFRHPHAGPCWTMSVTVFLVVVEKHPYKEQYNKRYRIENQKSFGRGGGSNSFYHFVNLRDFGNFLVWDLMTKCAKM